jgi:DNA-binding LacI/PurR family transcriptional regulator
LCKAAQNREIQGLISLASSWPTLRWMNKLPIPSAHLTSGNIPNKVDCDHRQLAELSLRQLARQGCRSVGLILPNSPASANPDGTRHVWMDFFERFNDLARDLGLTVRNEWMRLRGHEDDLCGRSAEQFGYEEFLKLWSHPERPEGLLVCDDTVARGVILAVREQQVRVPEDLKLVLHKNESIDLYCPLPATLVVTSEREIAQALIGQVQKQFRGETCELIQIGFTLSSTVNAEKQQKQEGARER